MDKKARLDLDMDMTNELYNRLKDGLTEKEVERLTPHIKATSKLLQEFELNRNIARARSRAAGMEMFITGTIKKLD